MARSSYVAKLATLAISSSRESEWHVSSLATGRAGIQDNDVGDMRLRVLMAVSAGAVVLDSAAVEFQ